VRADRLVSLLLLLQRRQAVTAAEAAAELEVSERTARRDFEALSMAGIPVYAERGRGGGWRLLGGARTDLSGLNDAEVKALFAVAGPAAAATPELKSALRKLVRALPPPLQDGAEASAAAIVVDQSGWGDTWRAVRPSHLDEIQSAVVDAEQVRLSYADRKGQASGRTVHPLGTVQKGATWYLIADTDHGLRTFRVDRIAAVDRTGQAATRPEGFELADAWKQIVDEVNDLRANARVTLTAEEGAVGVLRWMFGRAIESAEGRDGGRVRITVRGPRLDVLVAQLAGFGSRVEVESPPEAIEQLARIGTELRAVYG
jgi:predicted DNA-binding transcriptional regulator YafY